MAENDEKMLPITLAKVSFLEEQLIVEQQSNAELRTRLKETEKKNLILESRMVELERILSHPAAQTRADITALGSALAQVQYELRQIQEYDFVGRISALDGRLTTDRQSLSSDIDFAANEVKDAKAAAVRAMEMCESLASRVETVEKSSSRALERAVQSIQTEQSHRHTELEKNVSDLRARCGKVETETQKLALKVEKATAAAAVMTPKP